jgi:hypothetical protein
MDESFPAAAVSAGLIELNRIQTVMGSIAADRTPL